MCCAWCDERIGRVRVTLAEIWQRCFTCHSITWVDPYTLCCKQCESPVKPSDNVTAVCDAVGAKVPVST